MTAIASPSWETKRTAETRLVEDSLRKHFQSADAYRYNSASIRVRVVDPSFAGLSREKRDDAVEPILDTLPEEIQRDIVMLFTFAPNEISTPSPATREMFQNREFDHPSPSRL